MLIQERRSSSDTLKLYAASDDGLKTVQRHLDTKQCPRDLRGGRLELSAAEVLTMMVWGAWRGLGDKATLYYHICGYHQQDFPALGPDSKVVEATNRYSGELRGLLALTLQHNRQAQHGYPIVLQDSTAVAVGKVVRARHQRTFRAWARKSKTGSGQWYGFKLHDYHDLNNRKYLSQICRKWKRRCI